MHDQWYFTSEKIPDGLYLIEVVHSGQFLTAISDRPTLIQQEKHAGKQSEYQLFSIEHIGYRDYIIRHHFSGLVLTVHNASPSPCAPIVLHRYLGRGTPSQIVNFERMNDQSDDYYIFLKHTRMVMDIDAGSRNPNARLLQYPLKQHLPNQPNQCFRLHRIVDHSQRMAIEQIPQALFR